MAKNPAFQFYASDWLGSTKHAKMTPAQRGAYIDLLCHQWGEETCSLEDNDSILAVLSGMGEGWLQNGYPLVKSCFPPHPTLEGRIANPRLLEIQAKRDEWIEKSRLGGQKSAKKRWGEPKKDKGGYKMVTEWLQEKSNSPSPSPSPKEGEATIVASSPKATLPAPPAEFRFPLVGGKLWNLPAAKLEEYQATYAEHFDYHHELRKARQWLMDNSNRRPKTGRGILSFLTRWLNRTQDSSRKTMPGSTVAAKPSEDAVFNPETGEIVTPMKNQ